MQYFNMYTNQNNAIVAYQGRPTNVVEQIMKCVVESKLEYKNKYDNTIFVLWIYENQDSKEDFLQD